MIWQFEVTDTFGGEPNYSWVKRAWTKRDLTEKQAVRLAKRWAEWRGLKCDRVTVDDGCELRPRGMARVVFITYEEAPQGQHVGMKGAF